MWRLFLLLPAISGGVVGLQILADLDNCESVAISGSRRVANFTCFVGPALPGEIALPGLLTGFVLLIGSIALLAFISEPIWSQWATPNDQVPPKDPVYASDFREGVRPAGPTNHAAQPRRENVQRKRMDQGPDAEFSTEVPLSKLADAQTLGQLEAGIAAAARTEAKLTAYAGTTTALSFRTPWVQAAKEAIARIWYEGDIARVVARVDALSGWSAAATQKPSTMEMLLIQIAEEAEVSSPAQAASLQPEPQDDSVEPEPPDDPIEVEVAARLARITRLMQEGTITQAEYDQKRREIIADL